MNDNDALTTHAARWIIPVDGSPLENGCVVVRGEQIVAVGPRKIAQGRVVDHGDAILLPGLVNAHTHLEFSQLTVPLGTKDVPFHDWVHEVIAHRMSAAFDGVAAVKLGLQQSLDAGVTTIGDIATVVPYAFFNDPPQAGRVVSFFEMIGLSPERAKSELARLDEFLPRADQPNSLRGISPHAPYSVHPEIVATAAARSAERRVPLAFHLAEMREELQLLADGTGPLVDSLDQLGFWAEGNIPPGSKPLDYLRTLSTAHRSLIIHGNYLNDEDTVFLAEHADRMTVVYCPRTHHFFGHEPHPLLKLMRAGVAVAVGTDGRCSNPDLSLHDELRFIASAYPQLSPELVVRLGTLDGARALGLSDQVGTLAVGKRADLLVLRSTDVAGDPYETVLTPAARVEQVVYGGRIVATA